LFDVQDACAAMAQYAQKGGQELEGAEEVRELARLIGMGQQTRERLGPWVEAAEKARAEAERRAREAAEREAEAARERERAEAETAATRAAEEEVRQAQETGCCRRSRAGPARAGRRDGKGE
jgi:hypothetical protein